MDTILMYKHPTNKNLNIIKTTTFENLPLIESRRYGSFEFIKQYLTSNKRVIDNALDVHHRTIALRVDLHLPCNNFNPDYPKITKEIEMTRFIKSFKSKIHALMNRRRRDGNCTHNTCVNYIWVCEYGKNNSYHYHLVLFLNHNTFRHPGIKTTPQQSSPLINIIVEAWERALMVSFETAWDLVTIPQNAIYSLIQTGCPEEDRNYCDLFMRLSYFAKLNTKVYGTNRNSYGSSHRQRT